MSKETQYNPQTKAAQHTGKRSGQVKVTQLLATALAAVTAAFLGSRLGVAGTVTGAGVASVVSTIGTALYQNSLDRTGRAARKVRSRVVAATAKRTQPDDPAVEPPTQSAAPPTTSPQTPVAAAPQAGPLPAADPLKQVAARPAADQPTTEVTGAWAATRKFEPVRKPDPIADATTEWLSKPTELFTRPTEVADRPTGVYQRPAEAPTMVTEGRRRPRWRMLIGATALAFLLGMGAVTGIELLAHRPLSGGDTGTTLGGLFGGTTQTQTKTHPTTPSGETTTHRSTPTTSTSTETSTNTETTTNNPTPSTTTPPPTTTTTTPPTSTSTTTTGKQGAP
ncbi:MAG TPA: hypothetical protein VGN81_28335 [Pseudonocardiaceae bacterium]